MKLLSDKLEANLGYIYENLVAQMLRSAGHELFYHTFFLKKRTLLSVLCRIRLFTLLSWTFAGKEGTMKPEKYKMEMEGCP